MLELIYNWNGYNQKLFLALNHITNSNLYLAHILKHLSSVFFIANFAIAYLSLLVVYFLYSTYHKKYDPPIKITHYAKFLQIGWIYTAFGLSFAALKFSVNLSRPFCSIAQDNFQSIIDFTNERCLSSFPSAHTALAVIVTYSIWPYSSYKLRALCIFTIALVALSRISLAMHYPADIIYSILLTNAIIKITNYCYTKLYNPLVLPIAKFLASI